jgi:hypothetical protein
MKKVKCGTYPLVYPLPAVLLGTVINGRANFSTLGNRGIKKTGAIWEIINSYRHDQGDYLFIVGEKNSIPASERK